MGKVTLTEREDGNYEFQAECRDSLLVVICGPACARATVIWPEKYGSTPIKYLDAIMHVLENADQASTIIIPKVREYDEGSGDNLIEIYEIDKHEPT